MISICGGLDLVVQWTNKVCRRGSAFRLSDPLQLESFFYQQLFSLVGKDWFEVNTTSKLEKLSASMADRRPVDQEMSRSKKPRLGESDDSTNPYLAHMYENGNGSNNTGGLSHFKRHETTAQQAHEAESGPNNPFSGAPLSNQYFKILKTRRDLPVHKQRLVIQFLGNLGRYLTVK